VGEGVGPARPDGLFKLVFGSLALILVLYGLGMTLVILIGDRVLAGRMLAGFASMFVGVLGFGSGYLLGQQDRRQNPPDEPPPEAPRRRKSDRRHG